MRILKFTRETFLDSKNRTGDNVLLLIFWIFILMEGVLSEQNRLRAILNLEPAKSSREDFRKTEHFRLLCFSNLKE
jgi:hypothetical protein